MPVFTGPLEGVCLPSCSPPIPGIYQMKTTMGCCVDVSPHTTRSTQAGFVTLVALVVMVVIASIGTMLYTSLLGEVQTEISSRFSVSALAVAEAGAHWAANKLGVAGAATYSGDANQAVQGAGGQQVGVFDVAVTCTDGSAVSTGCPSQPTARLVTSTGYVPSKPLLLGRRKVQVVLAQTAPFTVTDAMCAYGGLNFDANVTVNGNVGSEGTTTPDVILQAGPPPSVIRPGGSMPGNVYAVTTVQCDAGCSTQVAGTVFPNQAPGTVCPNKTTVLNSYTCTPGTTSWGGGSLTITSSNASWNNITLNQGDTLTFDTTGLSAPLVVQVNSITAGDNTTVVVKGGGSVTMIVNNQMFFGQQSTFGLDSATGTMVSASRMGVESCSALNGNGGEDVEFAQAGPVSGVFIVPNGLVHMVQRQAQGAILSTSVQFDQGQGAPFNYDSSAQNFGLSPGFIRLISWQDVP
jgi:hypothetical protein